MTRGLVALFLPENPRRCRGDAAASRFWCPDDPQASLRGLGAVTNRHDEAVTKNQNLGVIRHNGAARLGLSNRRIVPQLRVRMAA
jgi:hypothetical protein